MFFSGTIKDIREVSFDYEGDKSRRNYIIYGELEKITK